MLEMSGILLLCGVNRAMLGVACSVCPLLFKLTLNLRLAAQLHGIKALQALTVQGRFEAALTCLDEAVQCPAFKLFSHIFSPLVKILFNSCKLP